MKIVMTLLSSLPSSSVSHTLDAFLQTSGLVQVHEKCLRSERINRLYQQR